MGDRLMREREVEGDRERQDVVKTFQRRDSSEGFPLKAFTPPLNFTELLDENKNFPCNR